MECKDLAQFIETIKKHSEAARDACLDPDDYGTRRYNQGHMDACEMVLVTMREWNLI